MGLIYNFKRMLLAVDDGFVRFANSDCQRTERIGREVKYAVLASLRNRFDGGGP